MSEAFDSQEVKGIEAALGSLVPVPAPIDRDRLMFRAGQATAFRRNWAWPVAAVTSACVAAVLGLILVNRPRPEPERIMVYVPVEKAPAIARVEPPPIPEVKISKVFASWDTPLDRAEYLRLQDKVLRWGLDAFVGPPAVTTAARPLTVEELLGQAPKRQDPEPWFPLHVLIPKGGNS